MPRTKTKATFIEPMLLLRQRDCRKVLIGRMKIKLDGYRALAIKTGGKAHRRSRNDNDFTERYSSVAAALRSMSDETVLDGEIAALDEEGRPSFNLLHNYGSADALLVYFVFDLLMLKGRSVMTKPLSERRGLLESEVLPTLAEPIRYSPELKVGLPDLIASVKSAGLEGLVAKRRNSRYGPGQRSGAWQKMRINRGQEFVIGGDTSSDRNFDALIFGYYNERRLQYVAARTRNGFTPSSREQLFKRLKPLEIKECPFANLPEARRGRWGAGLTAAKMEALPLAEAGARR